MAGDLRVFLRRDYADFAARVGTANWLAKGRLCSRIAGLIQADAKAA